MDESILSFLCQQELELKSRRILQCSVSLSCTDSASRHGPPGRQDSQFHWNFHMQPPLEFDILLLVSFACPLCKAGYNVSGPAAAIPMKLNMDPASAVALPQTLATESPVSGPAAAISLELQSQVCRRIRFPTKKYFPKHLDSSKIIRIFASSNKRKNSKQINT